MPYQNAHRICTPTLNSVMIVICHLSAATSVNTIAIRYTAEGIALEGWNISIHTWRTHHNEINVSNLKNDKLLKDKICNTRTLVRTHL